MVFYHHLFLLYLLFPHFLLYQIQKCCLIRNIIFLQCQSVFFFNSQPNCEYSNLLIPAAFSNSPFSGKTSSPVKNSYLPTFPDSKAEVLAVCLSKSYWALFCVWFCYQLFWFFHNRVFLNLNGLSNSTVVSFTKMKMVL